MTNWILPTKAGTIGQGWEAGQAQLTAGAVSDPITGLTVYAGQLGVTVGWTLKTKN